MFLAKYTLSALNGNHSKKILGTALPWITHVKDIISTLFPCRKPPPPQEKPEPALPLIKPN